jgi:hypothetical protein
MGSLSLQDTGLECTLHGINLFTLCVSNLHVVPVPNSLSVLLTVGGADYRGGECGWQH